MLKQELMYLEKSGSSFKEVEIDPKIKDYYIQPAEVLKNSFSKARNILIISKGSSDGIKKDMSVINSEGIVGIVKQTTENFSSVISMLYQDLKINAKLNNSGAFGSLSWEGRNPEQMTLSDVSVINKIALGDTIVTG